MVPYRNPVYPGYFADPFVLRTEDGYVAYGTGSVVDGRVFEVLASEDLVHWRRVGGALVPLPPKAGSDYWAPEVAVAEGRWWMYYSVGFEDHGHHLRVAVADSPYGPFHDCGVDLTPDERFAIDPSPFLDADGTAYLFFARDDLDGERPGTVLAVDVLESPTRLRGDPRTILRASADWQLFRRQRELYGRVFDWHTLEGPAVVRRDGSYVLLYSGGPWTEDTYRVAHATAAHPLGPWTEPPGAPPVLAGVPGHVVGPGHNSVTTAPDGSVVVAYHAWDPGMTARRMCIDPLVWTPEGPQVLGPTWEEVELPRR